MRVIGCTVLVKGRRCNAVAHTKAWRFRKGEVGLGAGESLLIGATALLISFLLTPLWQYVAPRVGLLEQPGPRRVHRVPTPTAGGVVVYVAVWASMLLYGSMSDGISDLMSFGLYVIFASGAIVALGVVDDLYDLKPSVKLMGQIAAALVFVVPMFGPSTTGPSGDAALLDGLFVPGLWGGLFAVVWLVAMTNMFNIIDGLDGLATGIASMAALPLFFIALQQGQTFAALLAAAVFGAGVGFLRYNVHPARLFLGDAGGMLFGFLLGVVSLLGVLSGPQPSAPAVALLAVSVPLLDTFCAVVRRSSRGQSIAKADSKHIHHQLLRHGLGTRQAVALLYGIGATMAVVAVVLARATPLHSWIGLVFFGFVSLPWTHRLGVLGDVLPVPVPAAETATQPSFGRHKSDARTSRFAASEGVDFREETGKFQGIAK